MPHRAMYLRFNVLLRRYGIVVIESVESVASVLKYSIPLCQHDNQCHCAETVNAGERSLSQ